MANVASLLQKKRLYAALEKNMGEKTQLMNIPSTTTYNDCIGVRIATQ